MESPQGFGQIRKHIAEFGPGGPPPSLQHEGNPQGQHNGRLSTPAAVPALKPRPTARGLVSEERAALQKAFMGVLTIGTFNDEHLPELLFVLLELQAATKLSLQAPSLFE